jgi:hypothetical protein
MYSILICVNTFNKNERIVQRKKATPSDNPYPVSSKTGILKKELDNSSALVWISV